MKKIISYSIDDTKNFADVVLSSVFEQKENNKEGGAVLLLLKGDLGSGKTAFTKCIGETLEIQEDITSPTFTIQKVYDVNSDKYPVKKLIHIDAYRLESGRELEVLGFKETLADSQNLICLEKTRIE